MSAVEVIAQVLGAHRLERSICIRVSPAERVEWWECLECGWTTDRFELGDSGIEHVKRLHLATEIDKALGEYATRWEREELK